MKHVRLAAFVMALAVPLASATHDTGCVVRTEDPASILVIDTIIDLDGDGISETYYCQEKDTGLPPIPLTGFLLGNGTHCYEESNAYPGLQTGGGGIGLLGDWFPPGCDREWGPIIVIGPGISIYPENLPEGLPCLLIDEDPISDDSVCGHPEFYDYRVL